MKKTFSDTQEGLCTTTPLTYSGLWRFVIYSPDLDLSANEYLLQSIPSLTPLPVKKPYEMQVWFATAISVSLLQSPGILGH